MQLRFHLAGINNQNFLMRDEQTGTYWQQITGRAIAGPLAGRRLALVPADDLTFRLWRAEQPNSTVLDDVPQYAADYAPENWDVRMAKAPTVISYAQAGLRARDLMIGIHASGASRAIPYAVVLQEKLIQDSVGDEPVLIVVGGDNQSVRVFKRRIASISETPEFYRVGENLRHSGKGAAASDVLMMDAPTGSFWNFQGCAIAGKLEGVCLEQVGAIKDYWFDWRNYNPQTTVYGIRQKIR
jgi:hypothetical protein